MLADLGRLRQHPIVWHAPLDVQERDAERHEERDPGDRHDARASHHAGREAMPEAFSHLYLTATEQLQRVDSRSEHGEQCRQRHHGDHHGDHEDADAAVGERSQEVQREDQSALNEIATVTALKATVRPAVSTVRITASSTERPRARSSRNRLTMNSE